jgi:hypothetical protein
MGMFGNIGTGLKSLVTPENLMLLGATMKDIGAGGSENFMGAQQMLTKQRERAAEQEWGQGLIASLGDGTQPPDMAALLPQLAAGAARGYRGAGDMASLIKASQPERAQALEGPDGIHERQKDGTWKLASPYPEKGPTAPAGYTYGADGKLAFIPGGPADPATVRALNELRRDIIVDRPMPSRPRAGGGGRSSSGGMSGLPSGFTPD